jgi:pilus assembly protein CpaB
MNSRRILAALLVALALASGVTFVVSRKLLGRLATAAQLQGYVAASRTLQPGEVLKSEDLRIIDWPVTHPLTGAFSKTSDIVGRAMMYPVADSQPILQDYLAAPGSVVGLTAKIPEGMRATSVKSDEVVGVAGFLFPGSRVDVLVTFHAEHLPTPATQIVLQDVEVLTAGQKLEPDPQGKPDAVSVVTLLLTPEDAQKLVLAGSQGTIQFVLRNGADHTKIGAVPMQMSQLSGVPPAAPVPSAVTPHPRLPIKDPYVVETILGDKRATRSFE